MKRAGPALLIAVMFLSACAAGEPRQKHFHASWLAEGPRTVRVVVAAPEGAPFYFVERHDVGKGALGGATAGMLIGGLFIGNMNGSCDGACARVVAAIIGGGAAIGALIGVVGTPGKTMRSVPLEEHEATRPLAPVMQQTGQDIIRRAAEMFAANLRANGRHSVSVAAAGETGPAATPADSEIEMTVSSIELVGPGPGKSARAHLRIAIQVRARWRGSTHTQRFRYRSEVAEFSDWADPGGEVAGQAARLAVSNLSGRIFNALAEP